MDRVMKISSNQSGAITASKNLVDFDIPAGMTYDLSKSYMVLNSSIETTDTHVAPSAGGATPAQSGGVGVYNVSVRYNDGAQTNRHFKNKHLVRNVSMFSQSVGMVEDIRRSDVLQYNLDLYRDDIDTQVNSSYNQVDSLLGANAANGVKWSPYRRLSPEGNEASDDLEREIRIDLKEVMNSCNNIWDGNKYGNTRVHAELNIAQLETFETLKANDGIWAATDGIPRQGVKADTTGGGGDKQSITTLRLYDNPAEDSPFYVGQKITFTGTIGATADNLDGFVRQITAIEHLATKALKLTFDKVLATGTIASDTAVTMKGCDAASSALNIDSAELVLYVTNQAPPPSLIFTTYKTEEDSFAGGGTNYNHQYYLDSNVQNIFWGSRSSDKQLGFEEKINTYRIRESGADKTDRDVTYGSSLHLRRLQRAFANAGMNIRNYTAGILNNVNRVSHLIGATGAVDIPVYMIGETTQVGEMPKLLDVNIVANGSFTNITLFKQELKQM